MLRVVRLSMMRCCTVYVKCLVVGWCSVSLLRGRRRARACRRMADPLVDARSMVWLCTTYESINRCAA